MYFLNIFAYFCCLFLNFVNKSCSNAEKDDFDQRMSCKAPVCLSKYTTLKKLGMSDIFCMEAGDL